MLGTTGARASERETFASKCEQLRPLTAKERRVTEMIDGTAVAPYVVGPLRGGGPSNHCAPTELDMNKAQLKKFQDLLEAKRQDILQRAQQTLSEDMALDADDLPDEMDLASSEYLQSFTFRLRGREKMFLDKIGKALERIQEGTFGQCDECGEEISIKRLEARPETTLCIRCKEDQERVEKDFG